MDELAGVLEKYVVLPTHAAESLALWIVHTYAFQLRDVSTYIGIESPDFNSSAGFASGRISARPC